MPSHSNVPVWEVDISAIGPVTISRNFELNVRKELEHPEPFYSQVRVIKSSTGFSATVTAFAPNPKLAENAALLFFGRMIDVLAFQVDQSLQVTLRDNTPYRQGDETIRRIIDRDNVVSAFSEARLLSLTETTFLRALGWYRKGKNSQDPFDKFLAFWNSIETVASKYNENKAACKNKGSICHIWECFKALWGECTDWEVIGGQSKWIDTCNRYRKDIAHGNVPIEVDYIEEIVSRLSEVEQVSYRFLKDWRANKLRPELPKEILDRLQ